MSALLFEHLPKTGGSSLRRILARQYEAEVSLIIRQPAEVLPRFQALAPRERAGLELIGGHGASRLEEHLGSPLMLTVVREPAARFVSQYRYIRSKARRSDPGSLVHMDDILTYWEFARRHNHDNLQTRVLAKDESWFSPAGTESRPMGELLERAKRNLLRYRFVFSVREFDLGLLWLQRELGWKKTPVYLRENVSHERVQPSPAQIENILELEKYDVELFRYAEALIEERLSPLRGSFDLEAFRRKNRWYQLSRLPGRAWYNLGRWLREFDLLRGEEQDHSFSKP